MDLGDQFNASTPCLLRQLNGLEDRAVAEFNISELATVDSDLSKMLDAFGKNADHGVSSTVVHRTGSLCPLMSLTNN